MVLALMAVGSSLCCHQKGSFTNEGKAVVLEATSALDGCPVEPASWLTSYSTEEGPASFETQNNANATSVFQDPRFK